MDMWMFLRRRRLGLLLLAGGVVSLVYVNFTDDTASLSGNDSTKISFLIPSELVQRMYFNIYDDIDDDNDTTEDVLNDKIYGENYKNDSEHHEDPNKITLEEELQQIEPRQTNQKSDEKTGQGETDTGKVTDRKDEGENRIEEHSRKMKANTGGNSVHADEEWTAPSQDNHQIHLLILAYMRTGSSVTGRILQYSPDVFYWYEPLHELERYYVTGGNISSDYRNLTLNEWFRSSAMAGGNISAALACDISHVYKRTLRDYFMDYGTFGTRLHYPCFRNARSSSEWNVCVTKLTNACRHNYKATAVKTIRLHMSRVVEVMRRDPKVKVLHLVRDPRAVLLSRQKLGYADFRKLSYEAELLCRKYKEDLDLIPAVEDPLRARYTLVRFEDMASVPLSYTHQLYTVMGIELTQHILRAIQTMTEFVRKERACPTCPLLSLNAKAVAEAWRRTMDLEEVRAISQECVGVLKRLGYRVDFEDQAQLTDMNTSAVEPWTFL